MPPELITLGFREMGVSDQERLAITGDGPREEFIVGMVGCHDSQGVGCVLVYKMGGKVRDLRNVNGMKALNELNHVLLERSRLNLVQQRDMVEG